MRVNRYDYVAATELAKPEVLPNGFLKVEGRISRVGIQIYRDASGKECREFRPPEEVHKQTSLDSFKLMPVTNTHPDRLLDARSARDYSVGTVGETIAPDGDYVKAVMMITDENAIRDAKLGRSQLSCGYSCELDPTPGEYNGQKYDAIQRNILGNHVALVDEARAGSGAAIRLDAGEAVSGVDGKKTTVVASNSHKENRHMAHVKIDGISYELNDANASTIQETLNRTIEALKKDAADAAKKAAEKVDSVLGSKKAVIAKLACVLAALGARSDAFKAFKKEDMDCPKCGGKVADEGADEVCDMCDGAGKISTLGEFGGEVKDLAEDPDGDMDAATEAEVEEATEEQSAEAHKDAKDWVAKHYAAREDRAKKILEAVAERARKDAAERLTLESKARELLGKDEKLDGKSNADVMQLVIKKLNPKAKLDGKSTSQVEAMFELLTEGAGEGESMSRADGLRGNIMAPSLPQYRGNLSRKDANDARANMIKRNQDALNRKTTDAAK